MDKKKYKKKSINIDNKDLIINETRSSRYSKNKINKENVIKDKTKKIEIIKIDIKKPLNDVPKTNIHSKKRLKLKYRNLIFLLLIIVSLSMLIYSCSKIAIWFIDTKKTNDQIDNLITDTEIIDINTDIIDSDTILNENTEIINPPNKTTSNKKTSLYWKYINENLIDVNFETLLKKNSDTVAWVQVKGTNINYPVVQTNDNNYYLNHSFNKTKNTSGWIFMDFRNNKDELNQNTILYAHSRVNGTMFGTLKNILKNNWYKNEDNHIIKTSTQTNNYLWQVFSVYIIEETSDYLQIKFSENEALKFFTKLKDRSKLNFDIDLFDNDKIITLSTCYGKTERVVMHAKLIKYEKKLD